MAIFNALKEKTFIRIYLEKRVEILEKDIVLLSSNFWRLEIHVLCNTVWYFEVYPGKRIQITLYKL